MRNQGNHEKDGKRDYREIAVPSKNVEQYYGDTFAGISGCIGLVVVTYAILTLPKFIKYARCRIFENGITVPTYKKKVIGNKKHKI
jgi:hypothetical protein